MGQWVFSAGKVTKVVKSDRQHLTKNCRWIFVLKTIQRSVINNVLDLGSRPHVTDSGQGQSTYHRTSHLSRGVDLLDTEKVSDCRLCYDVLQAGKQQSGTATQCINVGPILFSDNGPCLGTRTGPNREYEWLSYQQVIDKVHEIGSGLIQAGNDPKNNRFVGIFSSNRPEWTIADFGCQAYSMVPVALYETLGLEACKHVLNECEIATVICDKPKKVQTILDLQPDVSKLRMIVVIEPVADDIRSSVESAGLKMMAFEDILNAGKLNPKEPRLPSEDDVFTVCYTSGTTGNPKGVVVTHIAFVKSMESIHIVLKPRYTITTDDVHLSYLPLAHNFERGCFIFLMMKGVRIGFSSGDVKLLMDDLATLKPTFFPSVPRLLNRIYDSVQAGVKTSFIKSTLLAWALASKKKEIDNHIFRKDSFWDMLIFRKIQDKLGGRIKLVISGAAPLSADVMSFLRCALGCIVSLHKSDFF
ncbi:hypothetical protein RRG08_027340 [Elysia crispata]|uniref:long-chain-fatty-acid--CoA ligase n=1 Tax=Elysia crispata TaxID=231223 RepID=A0AAE1DJZ2_9GAST|nr:hypothetical protein RRG08_027340 [Elysia crispata]